MGRDPGRGARAADRPSISAVLRPVGGDRSLLVACKAYEGKSDTFDNLTLIKIPSAILRQCEWGRDDYSLHIANLPPAEEPHRTDLFDVETTNA